jgi:predicted AAA+ superfamily ATPase
MVNEAERWKRYILDALVETTISRDVLLLTRVDKPALLRRLFELGCRYSGQVLSYNKMLGQLHDAGNTTTLAHYLELLRGAGLLTGLSNFARHAVRQKGSSPKLQGLNTALMTAQCGLTFEDAKDDHEFWGRLVESAIGAHLANAAALNQCELFYWRDSAREVDFVVLAGRTLTAIEVKSGRSRDTNPGLSAFAESFRPARQLLVGGDGIPVKEFLLKPVHHWIVQR